MSPTLVPEARTELYPIFGKLSPCVYVTTMDHRHSSLTLRSCAVHYDKISRIAASQPFIKITLRQPLAILYYLAYEKNLIGRLDLLGGVRMI